MTDLNSWNRTITATQASSLRDLSCPAVRKPLPALVTENTPDLTSLAQHHFKNGLSIYIPKAIQDEMKSYCEEFGNHQVELAATAICKADSHDNLLITGFIPHARIDEVVLLDPNVCHVRYKEHIDFANSLSQHIIYHQMPLVDEAVKFIRRSDSEPELNSKSDAELNHWIHTKLKLASKLDDLPEILQTAISEATARRSNLVLPWDQEKRAENLIGLISANEHCEFLDPKYLKTTTGKVWSDLNPEDYKKVAEDLLSGRYKAVCALSTITYDLAIDAQIISNNPNNTTVFVHSHPYNFSPRLFHETAGKQFWSRDEAIATLRDPKTLKHVRYLAAVMPEVNRRLEEVSKQKKFDPEFSRADLLGTNPWEMELTNFIFDAQMGGNFSFDTLRSACHRVSEWTRNYEHLTKKISMLLAHYQANPNEDTALESRLLELCSGVGGPTGTFAASKPDLESIYITRVARQQKYALGIIANPFGYMITCESPNSEVESITNTQGFSHTKSVQLHRLGDIFHINNEKYRICIPAVLGTEHIKRGIKRGDIQSYEPHPGDFILTKPEEDKRTYYIRCSKHSRLGRFCERNSKLLSELGFELVADNQGSEELVFKLPSKLPDKYSAGSGSLIPNSKVLKKFVSDPNFIKGNDYGVFINLVSDMQALALFDSGICHLGEGIIRKNELIKLISGISNKFSRNAYDVYDSVAVFLSSSINKEGLPGEWRRRVQYIHNLLQEHENTPKGIERFKSAIKEYLSWSSLAQPTQTYANHWKPPEA